MNCSMWSHGYCPDCELYKGNGGPCLGYPVQPKDTDAATFGALNDSGRLPIDDAEDNLSIPAIRLKLVDVEHNTSRICDLEEARAWDWKNPEIMRVIGDWQIKDFDTLLFILREKEGKGIEEVEIFEAPRFMMLSGG